MASQKSLELDAFDIAILNAVQRCYTTPLRVIGEEVNLSTAAVQRRIEALGTCAGCPAPREAPEECGIG